MVSSLESLVHLTQLIVPYMATDSLVAAVASHCHSLELLDLSGTELVTDLGVVGLYKQRLGWELCPTNLTWTLRYQVTSL